MVHVSALVIEAALKALHRLAVAPSVSRQRQSSHPSFFRASFMLENLDVDASYS